MTAQTAAFLLPILRFRRSQGVEAVWKNVANRLVENTKRAISRAAFAEGPVLLAVRVGHGFIDPLTPLRMIHSDVSYRKKYRLPAWRRQATFLVFLVHNHVRGPCGYTGRPGRAMSVRIRDRRMAVA